MFPFYHDVHAVRVASTLPCQNNCSNSILYTLCVCIHMAEQNAQHLNTTVCLMSEKPLCVCGSLQNVQD